MVGRLHVLKPVDAVFGRNFGKLPRRLGEVERIEGRGRALIAGGQAP